MVKIPLLALFIFLAGCSSEEEWGLIEECSDDFYAQGIYSKETGERITKQSDTSFYLQTIGACRAKVELSIDGYRVQPRIEENDLGIYLYKESGGLKSYHKEKLKCETNPEECRKDGIGNKSLLFGLLGVIAFLCIGFARNIYTASLKKGFSSFFSFILSVFGAIGLPGSFVLMIWFWFNYLKEQPLFTMIWWILTCYSPYFIYTRLSRFVGYDIDSVSKE